MTGPQSPQTFQALFEADKAKIIDATREPIDSIANYTTRYDITGTGWTLPEFEWLTGKFPDAESVMSSASETPKDAHAITRQRNATPIYIGRQISFNTDDVSDLNVQSDPARAVRIMGSAVGALRTLAAEAVHFHVMTGLTATYADNAGNKYPYPRTELTAPIDQPSNLVYANNNWDPPHGPNGEWEKPLTLAALLTANTRAAVNHVFRRRMLITSQEQLNSLMCDPRYAKDNWEIYTLSPETGIIERTQKGGLGSLATKLLILPTEHFPITKSIHAGNGTVPDNYLVQLSFVIDISQIALLVKEHLTVLTGRTGGNFKNEAIQITGRYGTMRMKEAAVQVIETMPDSIHPLGRNPTSDQYIASGFEANPYARHAEYLERALRARENGQGVQRSLDADDARVALLGGQYGGHEAKIAELERQVLKLQNMVKDGALDSEVQKAAAEGAAELADSKKGGK